MGSFALEMCAWISKKPLLGEKCRANMSEQALVLETRKKTSNRALV
jgi:hypothetical protein